MNQEEIKDTLLILKNVRQILSNLIHKHLKEECEETWYKALLEGSGGLDVCIQQLNKKVLQ